MRGALYPEWRTAILASDADDYDLGEVLENDPSLAHDWLLNRVSGEPSAAGLSGAERAVEQAVTVLDREQRLSVLRAIRGLVFGGTSLAVKLVGEDLDLYKEFLEDEGPSSAHLAPLAGRPTGVWHQKAKLALAAGYSAEEVAHAAYGDIMSWSGSESDMWRGWEEQFAELESHDDAGVRAAAEVGQAFARQRRDKASREEHLEAVYGR